MCTKKADEMDVPLGGTETSNQVAKKGDISAYGDIEVTVRTREPGKGTEMETVKLKTVEIDQWRNPFRNV